MIRRLSLLAVLLALAVVVHGEPNYQVVSATNVAQYVRLTTAAQAILICNNSASANIMYFRLFEEGDTLAVATTSSSPIAIGACKSFGETGGKRFVSLSLLSAGTSTVELDSK